MIQIKNKNFVRSVLAEGGVIKPLMISAADSKGLGLCNPSVFIDNGEIWLILRNVNFTLYHCENGQTFNNRWGCLSYLNPENDPHLRTINFLCKLTPNLDIERYWKIDTSAFDKEPLWEFIGLEDARLVRWDGHLYGIGVRRDTTTNGQGRMEMSELKVTENSVKEISRYRIEHPTNPDWYCEKNWMPVLDMPYHFVKWANPVELVKADLTLAIERSKIKSCTIQSYRAREVDESDKVEGLPFLRGNSQVIPWHNYYICMVHDADLFWNNVGQKDAMYMHRFVVYDRNFNIVNITDRFSFLSGELEFCCGMAEWEKDLLIGFGYQDNLAFILRVPEHMIPKVLEIDKIDWGRFSVNPPAIGFLKQEVFDWHIYERKYAVREGDVVLDVGASVGPFIWSIKDRKAGRIIAVEPDQQFFKTLCKNTLSITNVEIVSKGIADTDGRFITKGLFSEKGFYSDVLDGDPTEVDGIRFSTLIHQLNIDHIDLLKLDCEGGEYDIFNEENFDWIKANVRHVAGEFHLHNKDLNQKWLHFRDTYLKEFPFAVYSVDGVDITDSVWGDRFASFYMAVMVYIDNPVKHQKWQNTAYAALEITTAVPVHGCPNHCAVCPQDKLSTAYNGVQTLSYVNFVKLIDKIPKDVLISFAGFCEPFVNVACAAMIRYAHSKGHKVSVFTTGLGMSVNDLEQIRDIPFTGIQGGFVLHLPDLDGYFVQNNWPGYMELMSAFANTKITNFETTTMGTLSHDLQKLFPNTPKRLLYSRAGNVDRPDVIRVNLNGVATCGCQERLYHNVLLPNGDVSLCCMDYGLNHILGNLYRQSYEEIIPEDRTPFELCKHCENGVEN